MLAYVHKHKWMYKFAAVQNSKNFKRWRMRIFHIFLENTTLELKGDHIFYHILSSYLYKQRETNASQ